MALVTLDEAREYLRVDSHEEDALIGVLLASSEKLCADVARLSDEQRKAVNGDSDQSTYTEDELQSVQDTMRVAVLYALAYLYEHREEADHHALTLTLRSLLFSLREGVV